MLRRGGKKDICPSCGKRTFVPYVLTADGVTPAGGDFGRCDREQKCAYSRYPDGERTVEVHRIVESPKQGIRLSNTLPVAVKQGPLYEWMIGVVSGHAEDARDLVDKAFEAYKVGLARTGEVIWWQIDIGGDVRTAKVMAYGPDGHRIKTDGGARVGWLHTRRELRQSGLLTGEVLEQCLFGEHLIKDRPHDRVIIVESEKTAVLMSALVPQAVWLACGGAQGMKNARRISVLEDRDVMLLPDEGYYTEWAVIAREHGWRIDDFCEEERGLPPGWDIADFFEKQKGLTRIKKK